MHSHQMRMARIIHEYRYKHITLLARLTVRLFWVYRVFAPIVSTLHSLSWYEVQSVMGVQKYLNPQFVGK